jgi:hypothetical protein
MWRRRLVRSEALVMFFEPACKICGHSYAMIIWRCAIPHTENAANHGAVRAELCFMIPIIEGRGHLGHRRLVRLAQDLPRGGSILQCAIRECDLIVRVSSSPRRQFASSMESILSADMGSDRDSPGAGPTRSRRRVALRLRAASLNSSRRSAHPCIIRRRSGRCSA